MKTKKETYPLLSKEIMEEKRKAKKLPQIMVLIVIVIIVLAAVSILIESDRIKTTLIIVIIIASLIIGNELPFGKIKEPNDEEITKLAKKKSRAFE